MDYLKECASILEDLNEEGQRNIYDFLCFAKENKRLQKGTTPEQLKELEADQATRKAEEEQQRQQNRQAREQEREQFAALQKEVCRSDSMPASLYAFFCGVSDWMPSFISWNPDKHFALIETVYTAGYRAAQAEQRKKNAQKKGKATI